MSQQIPPSVNMTTNVILSQARQGNGCCGCLTLIAIILVVFFIASHLH